jgi:hypothetical protein
MDWLPPEVVVLIMRSVNYSSPLRALVLTSSYFYTTSESLKFSFLETVLDRAIGELLPFLQAADFVRQRVFSIIQDKDSSGSRNLTALRAFHDVVAPHHEKTATPLPYSSFEQEARVRTPEVVHPNNPQLLLLPLVFG